MVVADPCDRLSGDPGIVVTLSKSQGLKGSKSKTLSCIPKAYKPSGYQSKPWHIEPESEDQCQLQNSRGILKRLLHCVLSASILHHPTG